MFQQLDEWRLELRTKFEEIEENGIRDENVRDHVEVLIKDNRISASKIQRLESDLVSLKLELSNNMTNPNTTSGDLTPKNLSSIHAVLQSHQNQIE